MWCCASGLPSGGKPPRNRALPLAGDRRERGRSSGVEHNLAKVGVEGSNPFARSRFLEKIRCLERSFGAVFCFPDPGAKAGEAGGKQQKA